ARSRSLGAARPTHAGAPEHDPGATGRLRDDRTVDCRRRTRVSKSQRQSARTPLSPVAAGARAPRTALAAPGRAIAPHHTSALPRLRASARPTIAGGLGGQRATGERHARLEREQPNRRTPSRARLAPGAAAPATRAASARAARQPTVAASPSALSRLAIGASDADPRRPTRRQTYAQRRARR